MTQSSIVGGLKRQYLWFDGHFNELFDAARNKRDKDVLRAAYLGSQKNLWTAQERSFVDDDPVAALLYGDLLETQERIERLAATGESERLIELITNGVGLGSRLAGCGVHSTNR